METSQASTPAAILLCAGYGTRMGALTASTPKPLLPVAGRPMLDYLVDQLTRFEGLGTLHVVSNHRHIHGFETWAADHSARGMRVVVHNDGSTSNDDRLGAIGDLEFVLERLRSGDGDMPDGAFVAAGDNIFCFDLAPLWHAFRNTGKTQVLALREDDPAKLRRTGVLELDGDRVVRLHEKPTEPPSTWACPPVYGLSRQALERLPSYLAEGHPHDEIGRFIADVVERQTVEAVRIEGERLHVGSPEALREASARMDQLLRQDSLSQDSTDPNNPSNFFRGIL